MFEMKRLICKPSAKNQRLGIILLEWRSSGWVMCLLLTTPLFIYMYMFIYIFIYLNIFMYIYIVMHIYLFEYIFIYIYLIDYFSMYLCI